MQRRTFVRSLATGLAAVGASALAPAGAAARFEGLAADLESARDDAAYWARVRREFLIDPGTVYLNTGTLGATPRPVIEAVSEAMVAIESDPASMVFGPVGHRMEDARARAAAVLGGSLEEVALTRNTTEAMNGIATGIDFEPGDEVLTTNHEHPGGLVGWEYMARRAGIKLVQAELPAPVKDAAQVLGLIEAKITPRTRVVCVSHVETITGLCMPLAALAEITRPRGILLVCDGAQAPGMLRIDVRALGVDAYASSSHKWLLAPKGSGLLYIRKEAQDRIRPMLLHNGWHAYTASTGTRDVAEILGHGAAIAFHQTIGADRVEARCRALNARLRDRLDALPTLRCLTPDQPELASGIVSYGLKSGKNGEAYERLLRDHRVVVKVVPIAAYNALRFSTHYVADEAGIDRAADAIAAVLKA